MTDRRARMIGLWPDLDHDLLACSAMLQRGGAIAARRVRKVLKEQGLGPTEFEVLAALRTVPETCGGALTPSALYDALVLSSGGVTQVLRTLEDKGLVTRPDSGGDRRSRPVALTPAGSDRLDAALSAVDAAERQALSRTDLTRDDLRALLDLAIRYGAAG